MVEILRVVLFTEVERERKKEEVIQKLKTYFEERIGTKTNSYDIECWLSAMALFRDNYNELAEKLTPYVSSIRIYVYTLFNRSSNNLPYFLAMINNLEKTGELTENQINYLKKSLSVDLDSGKIIRNPENIYYLRTIGDKKISSFFIQLIYIFLKKEFEYLINRISDDIPENHNIWLILFSKYNNIMLSKDKQIYLGVLTKIIVSYKIALDFESLYFFQNKINYFLIFYFLESLMSKQESFLSAILGYDDKLEEIIKYLIDKENFLNQINAYLENCQKDITLFILPEKFCFKFIIKNAQNTYQIAIKEAKSKYQIAIEEAKSEYPLGIEEAKNKYQLAIEAAEKIYQSTIEATEKILSILLEKWKLEFINIFQKPFIANHSNMSRLIYSLSLAHPAKKFMSMLNIMRSCYRHEKEYNNFVEKIKKQCLNPDFFMTLDPILIKNKIDFFKFMTKFFLENKESTYYSKQIFQIRSITKELIKNLVNYNVNQEFSPELLKKFCNNIISNSADKKYIMRYFFEAIVLKIDIGDIIDKKTQYFYSLIYRHLKEENCQLDANDLKKYATGIRFFESNIEPHNSLVERITQQRSDQEEKSI
jgi:hypothetical protein